MDAVDRALVERLCAFSTPSILNGLKRLGVRTRDLESLDRAAVRCMAPALGPRAGFATTRKVVTYRADAPVPPGDRPPARAQYDAVLAVPAPRFLVAENVGEWQGPVCIWGEVGASINLALGCVAGITNGPVRDVPEMEAAGFLTFAGGADVGGGAVETLEVGGPVEIGGVRIEPGDLLHGDLHGVVKVPLERVADLPDAIAAHEAGERRVIDTCRSPGFTLDALDAAWASERARP